MPPKFTKQQMSQRMLKDRDALVTDIEQHLRRCLPGVVEAYPLGYARSIINESINIALRFRIDDIENLRMFVDLRWRIAPGYYKEPRINEVLAAGHLTSDQKFELLVTDEYADAWVAAEKYDGEMEWRGFMYEDTP